MPSGITWVSLRLIFCGGCFSFLFLIYYALTVKILTSGQMTSSRPTISWFWLRQVRKATTSFAYIPAEIFLKFGVEFIFYYSRTKSMTSFAKWTITLPLLEILAMLANWQYFHVDTAGPETRLDSGKGFVLD